MLNQHLSLPCLCHSRVRNLLGNQPGSLLGSLHRSLQHSQVGNPLDDLQDSPLGSLQDSLREDLPGNPLVNLPENLPGSHPACLLEYQLGNQAGNQQPSRALPENSALQKPGLLVLSVLTVLWAPSESRGSNTSASRVLSEPTPMLWVLPTAALNA